MMWAPSIEFGSEQNHQSSGLVESQNQSQQSSVEMQMGAETQSDPKADKFLDLLDKVIFKNYIAGII